LVDGPANGYEVMHRIEERSGGVWRPSPGSIYPTLQMLEDEGLIRAEVHDQSRTYELTQEGRAKANTDAEDPSGAPWEDIMGGEGARAVREALFQTMMAARQLTHAGRPEQLQRGTEILQRARKELYRLLADE
jgi:DNA-binding PadR family transcriptional regulator